MMRRSGLGSGWLAVIFFGLVLVASGCPASKPSETSAPEPDATVQQDESPYVADSGSGQATAHPEPDVAETAEANGNERTDFEPPSLDVPTEPELAQTVQSAAPPAPLPASEAPLPLDRLSTSELSMPVVVLSDQHAAISTTKVGDSLPNVELPDANGQQQTLAQLFGSKLTLVVFWDGSQPTALEELSDLTRYYLPRFGDKGLAVVAINSGDSAAHAAELAKDAGASYPVLIDADRKAFAQVASAMLPRSYLLDASGKVIWFDLEYSPTTRRDLAVAIRHTLGE